MTTPTAMYPDPPAGYPLRDWGDTTGEPYFVPVELRADYARADMTVEQWAQATRNAIDPTPYDTWAHAHRIRQARSAVTQRQRHAEWERDNLRPCPVCGEIGEWRWWKTPRTKLAFDQPSGIRACGLCIPVLEHELRTGAPLATGHTRSEAARIYLDSLTERGAASPAKAAS